jgi:replication-associated recombination protein RarA
MSNSYSIKHRPSALEEVIGNTAIKKVLKPMIESKKFSHILLEGTTGSGKTTLAYIIANAFGAQSIDDVNCVHFSSINDMREKINSLQLTSFLKRRVLILDEIHRLSAQSQDVLLKPLEGGLASDVLIIACTTTVEKLSPMLLDRFKRLKVTPLSDKESLQLIERAEKLEKVEVPKWKKALIVDKCDGIPRRILSGLEKVSHIEDEKEVIFLLDLNELDGENEDVLDLFKNLLASASWQKVKEIVRKVLKSVSPEGIRVGLLNIISARIMSDYGTPEEKVRLAKVYETIINPIGFPEKSNIIFYIFKVHLMLKV